jgi:tetratricopeptide (TPR) repeat protein
MNGTAALLALWLLAGQQALSQIEALIEESRAAAARQDPVRADAAFREALDALAKVPPGDPQESRLNELMGDAAVRRGELELADQLYSRSLAALNAEHRQTVEYARVSNALGVVTESRNQAARARDLYDVALKIYETARPGSPDLARVLDNAGILEMKRAAWPAAEPLFRRSLAIKTAQQAPPIDIGATQGYLGVVLAEMGRLDEAGAALQLAAGLRRSHVPPLELASLLTSLARVDRLRERYDSASAAAREALELHRAQRAPTLGLAAAAHELGLAREGARAPDEALQLHREALGIREKLAPQSTAVAESLERVAVTTAMTGDGLAALNAFGRAVDAWARVSPNSFEHASVIHELGGFLVRRGDEQEGLRRMREAIEVLASAFAKGSGETIAYSRIEQFYDAPIRILAERGDAGEAFSLLERMRERQRLTRCAACDELGPAVAPLDALKRGIEPGTLVVAYRVQPDATYAFVATRDAPLRVYRIDEKGAALRARVQAFLDRVRTRSGGAAYEAPLVAAGRALFDLLFGQFEDEAGAAERLLIVADGPLDMLPFSALAHTRADASKWQYLVDWKPMIFAPSVTAAAAWAGGTAPVGAPPELFLAGVPAEAEVVGVTMSRGTLMSLWPQADAAGEEFAELFKVSLSGRPRETALTRAQRAMRDERGRTHPAQWAGYRYYGARGIR